MRRYIEALFREYDLRLGKKEWAGSLFSTWYIGGGTPSQLGPGGVDQLFKEMNRRQALSTFSEITFECNPEDLMQYPELPAQLYRLGVNRLSVGVQTTQLRGLQVLDRRCEVGDVYKSADLLERDFKGSLSYDFMLGWPGQTVEDFVSGDLVFLKERHFDHLSIYFINYEPGTTLERDRRKGRFQPLSEDVEADLWDQLLPVMSDKGLEAYEISSFAAEGQRSIHNRNTWRGHPYLGLGCGAVSRAGRVRWTNLARAESYVAKLENRLYPVAEAEYLTIKMQMQEKLMLSLRHIEGLARDDFREFHTFDPCEILGEKWFFWRDRGWLLEEEGRVRMSPEGWRRYDAILSDWFLALDDNLAAGIDS